MELYQFAKITGVAFKIFFPEGTTPEATPCQWAMGYSASEILYPQIVAQRLQTLATYQTSSCSAKTPVSRYFRTGAALARQGVEWFATSEFSDFNSSVPLYGSQLVPNTGSSTHIAINRPSSATTTKNEVARVEVVYYVTYKGTKGVSSIIGP